MQNIVIKQLVKSDYPSIRKVDVITQKQYLGEKWDSLTDSQKEEHLVSRKDEFNINLNSKYCFVAFSKNKVIGFIFAYETSPFLGNIYIRYIGIDTKYQGKGIGLLLYKQLIKKAKKNNIRKITALINLDNPNSIRLHEKVGFILRDRKQADFCL
ncbi:MAG: hypothetical protein CO028_02940 [Candidatus Levybacteria bacterium CG_4_9_14_0_2_um_filter_35_21]|nr:MAG: hypothetical protein CO028_02940 [Candidatus Levybacteria bacterium CG_4_9_14_0_2_um_filter_35_21]